MDDALPRRSGRLSLVTQVLLAQVGVVVAALLVATAMTWQLTRTQLHEQYGERVLSVADAVATMPTVRDTLAGRADQPLQQLAEGVRDATDVDFVVIADSRGIRLSHPNPSLVGLPVSTDPVAALAGRREVSWQEGTLGTSVRGKVPVRDDDGRLVGLVSVGVLQERVAERLQSALPSLLGFVAVTLGLAVLASLAIARRVKQRLLGLEPHEISALYELRDAMLHGLREGVVGVDRHGRITVANDEAQRLLSADDLVGRRLAELEVPALHSLPVADQRRSDVVMTDQRVLVCSRMPVRVRGETLGSVITMRDRTELVDLNRELDNLRDVADALRAQSHEHDNVLHTAAGLIELNRPQDALELLLQTGSDHLRSSDGIIEQVHDPTVAALLVAKVAAAAERRVTVELSPETLLCGPVRDPQAVVTVLGNLLDNAVEAMVGAGVVPGRASVDMQVRDGDLHLAVADEGPGLGVESDSRAVFRKGFTTKPPRGASARGLGLALVAQAVARHGGSIDVVGNGDSNGAGAVFTVVLRDALAATPVPP